MRAASAAAAVSFLDSIENQILLGQSFTDAAVFHTQFLSGMFTGCCPDGRD
jgi:hypothetical protein